MRGKVFGALLTQSTLRTVGAKFDVEQLHRRGDPLSANVPSGTEVGEMPGSGDDDLVDTGQWQTMNNNVGVDFTWSPRPGDWADALRAVVPPYRWAPRFAAALVAVSAVLLVLDVNAAALFGVVCAVVITLMAEVQVRMSFRNHPLAAEAVQATADDHSLRMSVGTAARSELAWEDLPGWSETRRGFVLRTAQGRNVPAYAVPHRAFAADADRDRFRSLLGSRVGPAS
ncbi:MAG TPA: YcxB family protein [Pseudonocardiaceae bacterium]|nr:YcxB family protein [Pseudonocardiaceae bacterium]